MKKKTNDKFPKNLDELLQWCEVFRARAERRRTIAAKEGNFQKAKEWSCTSRTLSQVATYLAQVMEVERRPLYSYPAVCWLCGEEIPFEPPHPRLRITRDHVVPASHGGGNGYYNQRPAHQICNNRRGNDNGFQWKQAHPKMMEKIRKGFTLPPPEEFNKKKVI